MALQYPLVHIDDITPEKMEEKEGWAISEFRLPITGAHGSSTTAFHSIFRPGSTHAKHSHGECEEIAVYLKGHGVVGQGDQRAEVREGHCRLMPKGSTHFFYNETQDEEAMVDHRFQAPHRGAQRQRDDAVPRAVFPGGGAQEAQARQL